MDYLILFGAAFLAATVLPFYSEIFLIDLWAKGSHAALVLAVATLGNTAGSVVNWYLGRSLLHFQNRPWFYFKQKQIDRASHWFQRYGVWSLLFAWLPIAGDVLTLVGGMMQVRLSLFLVLVAFGKLVRYGMVLYSAWTIRAML